MYLLFIILLYVYFGEAVDYLQSSFLSCFISLTCIGLKLPHLFFRQWEWVVWFEKKVLLSQVPNSNSETAKEVTFLTYFIKKAKYMFCPALTSS